MERVDPLVSVVIPTWNRPQLVVRAVRSALRQTLEAIEVIVVVDGPDDVTVPVLREINDSRVKIKALPLNLGPGEARNAGVGEAKSRWVAFLDDDDEWFPQKLEAQLQTAQLSAYRDPIVSCRLIVRSEIGDVVWPRRIPRPNESLSEYIFCRTSFFSGEGIIGANTIFARKELLQTVPFRRLQRHEDIDWLLRATTLDGVGVQFVPTREPLVIWHREATHHSMSRSTDWCFSLAWINENRHLVTPRAYTSFLMTWLSANAVREGDWKAFLILLREVYQYGRPTVLDAALYLGIWLIPQKIRDRIRISFQKRDRRLES
jgi:glycosyltransferase involved in cell wall biosynthesis